MRRSQAATADTGVRTDLADVADLGEDEAEEEPRPRRAKKGKKRRGEGPERESAAKIPHDVYNEQVLLGAAAADAGVRRHLLSLAPAESFFGKGHPEAWRALGELERRGLDYAPEALRQLGGEDVDADYVDLLVQTARERHPDTGGVPPNLAHHVECLRWDRTRIETARGPLSGLLELLRDPAADPADVRAKVRAVDAAFAGGGSLLLDTGQVAREQAERMRARRTGQACYPFGIEGLDVYTDGPLEGEPRLIPGAAPRRMTVLTGLSGSGKSTVLGRIILGQVDAGRRVLWGSWEEEEGDSLEQLAVMRLNFSRRAFQTGKFTEAQQREVEEEMERLRPWVRFFALPQRERRSAQRRKTPLSERALDLIQEHIAASGCAFVAFDLWRRMVREYKPDEEEEALTQQQQILKDTGVHGLLVHQQLLKDIEKWSRDKRPTREGLKGSGTWVETPDTILAVHRPHLWKNVPDDTLEVLVLKQRKAPWPLAVEFDMDPDRMLLTNARSVEVKRDAGEVGGIDSFLREERAQERAASSGGRRKRA